MVSADEFWALIDQYNGAVFPWQLLFAAVAVVLVGLLARKPGPVTGLLVKVFLAACYTWIGIVFYLILNRDLSAQRGYFQPILMFAMAALLSVDAWTGRTVLRWPGSVGGGLMILVLVAYSLVGYPVVGWLLGHPYGVEVTRGTFLWVPIFGVFPCPTTVFAVAMYAPALPRADKKVLIVLLAWALSSVLAPPMTHYGVYEDLGLFVAGVYGLVVLIRRWRARGPAGTRPTEADV